MTPPREQRHGDRAPEGAHPDVYRMIAELPAGDLGAEAEAECRRALAEAAIDRANPAALPAALRDRLFESARQTATPSARSGREERVPEATSNAPWLRLGNDPPWRIAAAVALAAGVGAFFWWRSNVEEHPLSRQFEGLAKLMARASDLRRVALRGGGLFFGTVEYSAAEREGWVVAQSLGPNDPSRERYAVWIEFAGDPVPRFCGAFDVPDYRCKTVSPLPLDTGDDVGSGSWAARVLLTRSAPASTTWSDAQEFIAEARIGPADPTGSDPTTDLSKPVGAGRE